MVHSDCTRQETIDEYFKLLKGMLESLKLSNMPQCIHNMDETGMPLDAKQLKRVAPKGMKKVHGRSSGNKTQITVVVFASASSAVIPPMVIFKGERLNHDLTKGEVPGTLYGLSENGWIDLELFFHWLNNHFVKFIPPTRPVLLLLDGHSTHFTPEAIQAAKKQGIGIIALPPHTTHQAQPLDVDVSFFKSLKSHWSNVCHAYMSENDGHVVTKFQFNNLFSKAWYLAVKPETIMNGFRKTGVYPLNEHAITLPSLSTTPSAESSSVESAFSSAQLVCFQQRYDNGYDIFVDKDYCRWLSLNHPEALPDDFGDDDAPVGPSNDSSSPDGDAPVDPSNSSSGPDEESFSDRQIATFEERYESGYDLVFDKDYIRWLTLHHPDALPQFADFTNDDEDTHSDSPPDHSSDAGDSPRNLSSTPVRAPPPPPTSFISPIQPTPDSSSTTQASESLSRSLENTRRAFSAISNFLEFPGGSTPLKKTTKSRSGAKVLTSEQSLALLEEKARKKKEEEEAKEQRKREREEKKAKREEENKQKAEERAKKAEERAKKAEERAKKAEERKRKTVEKKLERERKARMKQSGKKKASTRSSDASGLQSAEVSSNECAVCLGEYEDDIGEDGELLVSWVECTNPDCKKWMHEECLPKNDDDFYICNVCNSVFC